MKFSYDRHCGTFALGSTKKYRFLQYSLLLYKPKEIHVDLMSNTFLKSLIKSGLEVNLVYIAN